MLYLTSLPELQSAMAGETALVVGCYSDWCPASSQSKPVFERVAAAHQHWARFAKVRTDESPDIAGVLSVTAIPSFYVFRTGRLLDTLRGSVPEARLIDWIRRNLRENAQQQHIA